MATDNFERCLAITLKWEGGYSNHPDDPGGPTMRGIIQREYDAWRRKHGKAHALSGKSTKVNCKRFIASNTGTPWAAMSCRPASIFASSMRRSIPALDGPGVASRRSRPRYRGLLQCSPRISSTPWQALAGVRRGLAPTVMSIAAKLARWPGMSRRKFRTTKRCMPE